MEVSGATISVTENRVDAWLGSQNPPSDVNIVAGITGHDPNDIYVHNNFLGGGFGGSGPAGMGTMTATYIANEIGLPVKMHWSREGDLSQNFHRPANATRFQAVNGADGLPLAMFTRSVNPSLEHDRAGNRITDHPYSIPNRHHEVAIIDSSNIGGTHHRAPGSAQNGFMIEQFVDEMALAGGWDPLEWRIALTKDRPDMQLVLNAVKDSGAFTTDLPKGEGTGLGMIESHGTLGVTLAHVTVSRRGQLRVEKVTMWYDCGHVVNPTSCKEQMESCITWEQSHTVTAEIYIQGGRITSDNFDTYKLSRIGDTPEIEVIAALSGGDKWGGMGEPGSPPVAASIGNAIFFATGKRIRSTPISSHDLSWS
jgi:isoquinoline 1-oxidoreductase beta subunit